MALISLDHVSKVYPRGTRPALDDVTLHVERGDFVFLVGASGSGKTTLLSLLLREEEATDGEIRVAGNDLRRLTNRQVPQYRRSIGFVFQDYKLLNNKTVWQNVAFALEVIGTSRSTIRALVPKVLETVGLTGKERNYPHELSGGEQQRVAIARAYVNHTTIVMATHNEEIVNSMRKRVVELHNGKIVRDEAQGSYDSALYFPDAEVESKAQLSIESNDADARFRPDGDSASADATIAIEVTGDRRETAAQVVDAVSQAVSAGAGDEGIARLAQSVHSGRTGRYGEAFAPVEDTLTWGRGLSLEEYAEAERRESGEERQTEPGDAAETATETDDAQPAEQTEAPAGEQQTPEHADESTAAPVPPAPAAAPPLPPAPPMPPTQPDRSSEEDSTGEEN